MPKTKDRVADVAGTAKPYVERALNDEELRDAREAGLRGRQGRSTTSSSRRAASSASPTRVAGDQEIQDNLRVGDRELRAGGEPAPGPREETTAGATLLLLAGVDRRAALQPGHGAGHAPLAEGEALRRRRRVRLRRPRPSPGNGSGG